MLQNAYLLAKIGADAAENERKFAEILPKIGNYPTDPPSYGAPRQVRIEPGGRAAARAPRAARGGGAGRGSSGARGTVGANFAKFLQIFGGLVLGCIKTKFCKKVCVRQHFSSSTRCASFCTAATQHFRKKSV